MPRGRRPDWTFRRESRHDEADRVTASLAGLAMALALVVLCLFLTDHLRIKGQVEDCLFAGRADCVALAR